MQNFDLYTPARILFGKGEEKRIGIQGDASLWKRKHKEERPV